MLRLLLWVWSLNVIAGLAFAESLPRFVLSGEDRQRIERQEADPWRGAKAYKLQLVPNWDESGNSFWYRNSLPGGKHEYFRVVAETGEKQPISDIKSLKQLQTHTGLKRRVPRRSANNGPETNVTFENKTAGEVELFWLNADGEAISYGKLGAGQTHEQHTFAGHVWSVSDAAGTALGRYQAQEIGGYVEITGPADTEPNDSVPIRPRDRAQSPDGQWRAFSKDHNLWLQPRDGDAIPLTTDGARKTLTIPVRSPGRPTRSVWLRAACRREHRLRSTSSSPLPAKRAPPDCIRSSIRCQATSSRLMK